MDFVALSSRLVRRWWVVLGLAALAALGAATAGASRTVDHKTKIQFVLRPDASVSNNDLPGTLDALKSDGTLVQTVIGVLRNRAILRRAAADVGVPLSPAYSVDSTAQPGSTLIDSTLSGPDRSVLTRLSVGYAREASTYVAASYAAYVLERISTDSAPDGTGPGTGQVAVLAALLGAALGVLLVAAELRLEPRFQRLSARRAAEREREPRRRAVEREPKPERAPEPRAERAGARGPEPRARARAAARTRAEGRARADAGAAARAAGRARAQAGAAARAARPEPRAPQPEPSPSDEPSGAGARARAEGRARAGAGIRADPSRRPSASRSRAKAAARAEDRDPRAGRDAAPLPPDRAARLGPSRPPKSNGHPEPSWRRWPPTYSPRPVSGPKREDED